MDCHTRRITKGTCTVAAVQESTVVDHVSKKRQVIADYIVSQMQGTMFGGTLWATLVFLPGTKPLHLLTYPVS